MQILEKGPGETAREYVLRVLKYNIITLELAPGTMLSAYDISDEIGLSRTPVREALIELSKTRIVEILPQRGSVVSLIDYELVEESRFLRLIAERAVVELVCEQGDQLDLTTLEESLKLQEFYREQNMPKKLLELDNGFHEELFRLCNKRQTHQLVNTMTAHFDRVRTLSLDTVKDLKIVEDHQAIIQAIRDKNPERGKELITQHLTRYKIDEAELRARHPEYFK